MSAEPTSVFISAPDGLRLHARYAGPRYAGGRPIACLPGLTRTTADFDPLTAARCTHAAAI
jgi:hypothetical protein